MSGLSHTAIFSNLMLYLGILGIVTLIVFIILTFLKKETHGIIGVLVSLILFLAFLVFLEGPRIIQAQFKKPVEVAQKEPEPTPEPVSEPTPSETVTSETVAPAPAEQPSAPEPTPVPVPEPPKPLPTPAPKPGPTIVPEPVKPQPPPTPKPTPVTPPPSPPPAPTPESQPSPAPTPTPSKETPPPRTAPSGAHRMKIMPTPGGTGTIEISIKGPILETAKEHKPSAHLMIVLDGKWALVILPTRFQEQKKENEFGESVLVSVTYFWEGVYAGFDNVPAGPHSVMIDVSLEGPETHKAKMAGAGNLENDWNGFVTVPNGGSVQLGFGAKNWVTQELERIR